MKNSVFAFSVAVPVDEKTSISITGSYDPKIQQWVGGIKASAYWTFIPTSEPTLKSNGTPNPSPDTIRDTLQDQT